MLRMLSYDILRVYLSYDPDTGKWIWLRKTSKMSGRIKVGEEAGTLHVKGYRVIRLFGIEYRSAPLAFYYMTEKWPKHWMDHINGIRDDDRWCNLREANPSENAKNAKRSKANSTGLKGVTYRPEINKWRARIMVEYKSINLGNFDTKEAAYDAYCNAAKEYHKDFARTA